MPVNLAARRLAEFEASAGKPKGQPTLRVRRASLMEITVGELTDAVNSNPDHPIAKKYSDTVKKFPASAKTYVDSRDLKALLENGSVEVVKTTSEEGEVIEDKVFVSTPPSV